MFLPPSSRRIGLPILLALLLGPAPLLAQTPTQQIRVGVSLGGTGFLGILAEYIVDDWGAELNLGTLSFREIAVAVTGKRYFTDGRIRPAVGLGLWSLTAWTEDGSGSILLLRAPVAADWDVARGHALGVEVAWNRALAVNRLDPDDDTPPNRSLVPLPGFYYRYGWEP